jgi:hypothetical protein
MARSWRNWCAARSRRRESRRTGKDVGRDVFVGHVHVVRSAVGLVGLFYGISRIAGRPPLGADQTVESPVGQGVVAGAVHGVVAAHDGSMRQPPTSAMIMASLARNSRQLRGGVSRPSRKGWMMISPDGYSAGPGA